jgi:hypothetical protein
MSKRLDNISGNEQFLRIIYGPNQAATTLVMPQGRITVSNDQFATLGTLSPLVWDITDIPDAGVHIFANAAILDAVQVALTNALKSTYDGAVTASAHTNRTILDAIEVAFTTALKNTYDSALQPNGISDSFTTVDSKTVTVVDGQITSIA